MAAFPLDWSRGPLGRLPDGKELVLVTAHRRESFGGPLHEICLAIADLARMFEPEGVHFVYPVHLNPQVQKPVAELLTGLPNVSLLPPLDYLSMVHVMRRSILVLTDSGGIQEEAPSLKVPVLVLRETTERPEGIEAGVARLVGTRRHQIVDGAEQLLRHPEMRAAMVTSVNPYGDGRAAPRIVARLLAEDSVPEPLHPAAEPSPPAPREHRSIGRSPGGRRGVITCHG